MAYTSRHTGAEIDKAADLSGIFHVVGSGSTASVTSGTTQRAQWKGSCKDKNSANLITSLTDGLSITYRPDVAGDASRGVTLNINNLGEHPVVINASGTTIGTRCEVGNTILLTYNSAKTASVIVSGANTSFTGVWQVVNFDGVNASTAYSATKALQDGSGNIIENTYLPKLTYEYSKQLGCDSNGKVCIGKFSVYDSNITIDISSTTAITYNATIVIATQNYFIQKVTVYGDAQNIITPLIKVVASNTTSGSANYHKLEVYANLAGWSKNAVHIKAVGINTVPTDILTNVSAMPTENLYTNIINDIRSVVTSTVDTLKTQITDGTVTAKSATTATKLGTSNVGSSSKPIYLEAGVPKEATIPTASSSTLGLVKSSTTGTMSGRDYNVQVNSDGTMKVNVPWSYTFTNKNALLSWNTTTTIATVGGTNITVSMPSNPAVEIQDNLTSTSTSSALSAKQGKVLKDYIDDIVDGTTTVTHATDATKLTSNAGSATQPVYFSNGVPVATTYKLEKSVPSNAVFTDTNTWRGIQNNLTSTSTTDSLSANQGKILKGLVDGKAASSHTHYSTDIEPPTYTTGTGMPNLYETYVQDLRANRLAFLPPEQIYIETSTDGGTTWTAYNPGNSSKTYFFSKIGAISIPLPKASSGKKSCSCLLRITLTGMRFKTNSSDTNYSNNPSDWIVSKCSSTERYCSLDHMYIWCSSNSDKIYCKVEKSTGANPTSWVLDGEGYMSGWSGGNYIKLSGATFGGYTGQTTNYWHRRITFRTCTTQNTFNDSSLTTGTSATTTQQVSCVLSYGKNCWSSSNTMMHIDHLYDYDNNKNATFPGKISCSAPTGDNDVVNKKYLTDTIKSAINNTLGGSY